MNISNLKPVAFGITLALPILTAMNTANAQSSVQHNYSYTCVPMKAGMVGFELDTSYQPTARPDFGHGNFAVEIRGLNYTDEDANNQYFHQGLEFYGLEKMPELYQTPDAFLRVDHDLFLGGNLRPSLCPNQEGDTLAGRVELVDEETNTQIYFWCSRPAAPVIQQEGIRNQCGSN